MTKITYSNIRLYDGKGQSVGVAPDVTLEVPAGRGTVQFLYEHLKSVGYLFNVANYSHSLNDGPVHNHHQRT